METRTRPEANAAHADLRQALEESGHRFTGQRAAVFDALYASTAHPTADEIFGVVRGRIPDISLATVYKALEALVSCGLANRLTLGSAPARYDGRTDEHHHMRCLGCGTVRDVEASDLTDPLPELGSPTDFQLVGYRLELVGYCSNCTH